MYRNLVEFCEEYNVPIEHLGSILKDPKVIPMIRGKAFEFSACDYLTEILDENIWKVSKPFLNAQFNSHDEDVLIEHLQSSTKIRVECKMSAKGAYSYRNNTSVFRIKCMRSRTLGVGKVQNLAALRQLNEMQTSQLSVHNDNYLPGDFDLVLTTLANAFYVTNDDGIFVWSPSEAGMKYLEEKFGAGLTEKEYQSKAYSDMYIAKSTDIAVNKYNDIICPRRNCTDTDDCGYIPNYPLLTFDHDNLNQSTNKWLHITNIEHLLNDFIPQSVHP